MLQPLNSRKKMNAIKKNRDLIEMFEKGASERASKKLHPIFPDLVDHLVEDIYGFAYRRTGLDIHTRHLVSLGILAAMGDCNKQLNFQLGAALNLGISRQAVQEVLIQVAVFSGNARAINAALILHKVVRRRKWN